MDSRTKVLVAATAGIGGFLVLRSLAQAQEVVADFSASPRSGSAPLTVVFTDLSSGGVTSWLWDFGDGTSSPLQDPTHVYSAEGVYTVSLVVASILGTDTKSRVNYITVAGIVGVPGARSLAWQFKT